MPGYEPIMLASWWASWTLCGTCRVPVRAQDQAAHDAAVHAQRCPDGPGPVLEEAGAA